VVLDTPAVVTLSDGRTERDARLLVAGDYPGKNLTVTEADLDALVANFSGPIPVKVEHIDSPLDPLGVVERVWRQGSELLGRVRFPAEMAAFLSKRDAHKLSVGLLKEPQWKLLETSLTLTPHVPTATLLSQDPRAEPRGFEGQSPAFAGQGVTLSDGERAELAALRQTVRRQTVDAQIAALKASGRVIPATEALARVLLAADESAVVTLSDGGSALVAGTFRRFLDAQPPLVRLGEVAHGVSMSGGASGAAASAELPSFSDEEHEVLRRLGVRPEDVAKTMADDAAKTQSQKASKA
jgi:hypothetical protein